MKKSAWVFMVMFAISVMATGVAVAGEGAACSKGGNIFCSIGGAVKNSPVGQFFTKRSDEYKTRQAAGK